jgi:hypothetical protein
MKTLKSILTALTLTGSALFAQDTFIKGSLDIKFDSRQKPGVENVTDKYTLNLNVSNSAIFRGTIENLPFIDGTFTDQTAKLIYALETDIVNPANPAQTRNVGKIYGTVPVNENNIYDFSAGNVTVNVFGIGAARGFESKFSGQALGKPPANKSIWATMRQEAMSITNGRGQKISVGKYDKMEFSGVTLAAGPAGIYPEGTVSGSMIFDYARSAWHFNSLTLTYTLDGKRVQDNLTGNIRWDKDQYIWDLKINEPVASESAVFAGATDEASFFAVDSTVAGITGSMRYKDVVSGEKAIVSAVKIDLTGNKLNKQQTMFVAKMIFLVAIVPFNSE